MITGVDVEYKNSSSEETAVGNLFYPLWKNSFFFTFTFYRKPKGKKRTWNIIFLNVKQMHYPLTNLNSYLTFYKVGG